MRKLLIASLAFPLSLLSANSIYWTLPFGGSIQKANSDGSNAVDVITGLGRPIGIEYNPLDNKIYWVEFVSGTVNRANRDGTAIEQIASGFTNLGRGPKDIVVDALNEKLYWSFPINDQIFRSDFNGDNLEVFLAVDAPDGLALDSTSNTLFFTQGGSSDNISKVSTLGGAHTTLVSDNLSAPTDITIDLQRGKIYWTDFGTQKIERANFDGSLREEIISSSSPLDSGYSSILYYAENDSLYWTNFKTEDLTVSEFDGGDPSVIFDLDDPGDLTFVPESSLTGLLTSAFALIYLIIKRRERSSN